MLVNRKIYVTVGLIMSLIFLGCSDQSESKATKESKEKTGHSETETAKAKSSSENGVIKGTVLETFESGGYTYLKLDTGEEEVWAATAKADVQQGESVELMPGPVMKNFHSKSLNRTFPEIIFSGGVKGAERKQSSVMGDPHGQGSSESADQQASSFEGALKSEGMGGMSSPAPGTGTGAESGGSQQAVTSAQDISVEKSSAENGYTIGEIYKNAGELDGEKVSVRGKVMKVSPNIMGRTWIHLQDGTGNAMKNTHDLVFTSTTTPKTGEIVEMEGVLAKDRDFGAGYKYDAIVEEAEVVE